MLTIGEQGYNWSNKEHMPWKPLKGGAQEASWSENATASAGSFQSEGATTLYRAPARCGNSSACL